MLKLLLFAQSAWAAEYTDCITAEGYDTKQSCGEAQAILELLRMWSTPLLLLLPGPLWPRMVTPDRVLSMGQVEHLTFKLNANK